MSESRPEPVADAHTKSQSPVPESPQTAGPLADLQALIDEIRAISVRLFGEFASLAVAQWRLSSYVLTGTAALWAVRLTTKAVICGLLIASWVLLNVAVWSLIAQFTTFAAAPPLALVALNLAMAVALNIWQRGIRVT